MTESGGDLLAFSEPTILGPPVRPPERSGFGSLLIDRAVSHDLKGTATRHCGTSARRRSFFC
ncbi:hypothetical protein HLH36_15735 [Gluconacetobacter aggeris]|uniref:Uncharacterized protein n=1 Tax=Gluconacetobacter aggeris TaxID=1286186 RepID=A0A7W4IVE3_9PROT|nr:hypothetical protein [Gluconacetobacter aggeris]MBB2169779.1 hypothetical protein [Gluconacetobacter aggeris]